MTAPTNSHPRHSIGKVIALIIGIGLMIFAVFGIVVIIKFASNLGSGVVNCKTFRTETQQVMGQFAQGFTTIERRYTCIAGLDMPDKATITIANDAAVFASEQALRDMIASRFKEQGWTVSEKGSFAKHRIVEKNDTTYSANVRAIGIAPAVIQVEFNSTRDAFTDFASSKEFPADIKMSASDAKKHAVVQAYTPSFVPEGYAAGSVQLLALDRASVELKNASVASEGKESVSPSFQFSPARLDQPASTCGGSVSPKNPKLHCEFLGKTTSGIDIYVPMFVSESGERSPVSYAVYAILDKTEVVFMSIYHHPNVKPQFTNDEILRIIDSLQPVAK